MKQLILVRHGEYDEHSGHLNDHGRKQMELVASVIQSRVNGGTLTIFSSSRKRAMESAAVIGQILGAPTVQQDWLEFFEDLKDEDCVEIHSEVLKQTADVLVLVTHYPVPGDYSRYYTFSTFGVGIETRSSGKGEGGLIDCEGKTVIPIP